MQLQSRTAHSRCAFSRWDSVKSILVGILLFVVQAQANLSRTTISNLGVSLYGVYMTSDPSCQVGLVPSVPLAKSPTTSNFVSSPVLGAGPVPNRVACVILIIANQIQVTWQAGSYVAPDNVCSAGGTANVNPCVNTNITWPASITQAAAASGLNLSSSCASSPTGTEVVPIFMSIDSSCTGSSVIDQQTTGCTSAGKSTSTPVQAPISINSTTSGSRIMSLPVNGRIVFVVDPDQMISGSTGICSAVSTPVFSIHQ